MRYRDFLISRVKASWQSTLSFLKEHLRVEIATVLAGAVITGYFQGETLVMKFFGSLVGGLAPLALLLCLVFLYHYARYPFIIISKYERSLSDDQGKLEIVYHPGVSPFDLSRQAQQSFSVGVMLRNAKMTVEDVTLRLEKLEPTTQSVPLLYFREMIYPFAETYAKQLYANPNRSVNINPDQMRYFEIVFSYGGSWGIELCFFPTNYPLTAGTYLLALRATGKNCRSEYVEFKVATTDTGLVFDRL